MYNMVEEHSPFEDNSTEDDIGSSPFLPTVWSN